MKLKVLILTNHTNHTIQNSVYDLARELFVNQHSEYVDIATVGNNKNNKFFKGKNSKLFVQEVDNDFKFSDDGKHYFPADIEADIKEYDLVLLRLPQPINPTFFEFLSKFNCVFVNDPMGVILTSSKAFLMKFKNFCPPMKVCKTIEEVNEFAQNFPIVLKPIYGYGGKGIVKIESNIISDGTKTLSVSEIEKNLEEQPYLAVKFLKNVSKGDKRILVVNGKILGASLRVPASDNWLCNVAQGGTSLPSELTIEEYAIVEAVAPAMEANKITMYGIDTLENDEGKRVLSEINTTSIGGFIQLQAQQKKPYVRMVANEIFKSAFAQINNTKTQ